VGELVLVPTPIGNLQDITLRALEVLRTVDAIAAEDTRHSRKLLDHHAIDKPLVRLDAHTIGERGEGVLDDYPRLAFITDAGTPGISDPGAELVGMALRRGYKVEALPGPTAFVPALVLSGLPLARFTFEGFLPRKGRERKDRIAAIAASTATTVLYESPRRLAATLAELGKACGDDRPASVSRELSKRFETNYRGTLGELARSFEDSEVKGEIVVVIGPATPRQERERERDFALDAQALAAEGLSGKALREALVARGAPRNLAYRLALDTSAAGEARDV
jgi:16S rRNA (cytidine1402-2'-O)-methyltransferase